jgi:hypothetical protein
MIEFRYEIDIADMSAQIWETKLYLALKKAGVPVNKDGTFAEVGVLERFDDPADFGACTYRWRSKAEIEASNAVPTTDKP